MKILTTVLEWGGKNGGMRRESYVTRKFR